MTGTKNDTRAQKPLLVLCGSKKKKSPTPKRLVASQRPHAAAAEQALARLQLSAM